MTVKKRLFMCLFLVWGLLITGVGASFAKYTFSGVKDFNMRARGIGTFQVLDAEEETLKIWQVQPDGSYRKGFTISNQDNTGAGHGSDLCYTIAVACAGSNREGVLSLVVTNAVGLERIYTGTKEAWGSDTLQYQEMGPGYYWRFLDSTGEEYIWTLTGGQVSHQEFVIQVQGMKVPALMDIIVTETTGE